LAKDDGVDEDEVYCKGLGLDLLGVPVARQVPPAVGCRISCLYKLALLHASPLHTHTHRHAHTHTRMVARTHWKQEVGSLAESGAVGSSQEQSGAVRSSQEQWGAVGSSREQWGAVGSSQEQSGAVRSSLEQ
jgi:hypothetical protein